MCRKLRNIIKDMSSIDQEIVDSGGQSRKMYGNLGKENYLQELNSSNIIEDKCTTIILSEIEVNKSSMILKDLNKKYDKLKKKLHLITNLDNNAFGNAQIQNREKSISIIDTDIPRTFPMLGFFKVGGVYYEQLQRMLEAFTVFRPDIGYV